jgi:hypothetical protein
MADSGNADAKPLQSKKRRSNRHLYMMGSIKKDVK